MINRTYRALNHAERPGERARKVGEKLAFFEEYLYWRVAEFLIEKKEYRILQLSPNQEELWLEKIENKQAQVIRLIHYNIDWSNWLQRDIEMTAAAGEQVRKQLAKGELTLLNLYFSAYPPVDDYEFRLAEPYNHSQGGKVEVKSILFDRTNGSEAIKHLDEIFDEEISLGYAEEFPSEDIERMKKNALFLAMNRAKAEKEVFNYGKPFFTYAFIVIQILVFILMEALGGSTDTGTLIKFGAKFNPLILEGEWWRFFTPVFIHIGLLHLLMNTLALYYLGSLVERLYGNVRFLVIYIAAGFAGVLASFIFSTNLSAGASGAIFGCFGALLYFGVARPRLFWRTMGLNILVVLAINLAFGFSIPGIDNAGHIGGLVGGFATAGVLHLPKKKRPVLQAIFLAAFTALVAAGIQYGFSGNAEMVDEQSILVLSQQHIKKEEYDKAYDVLSAYGQKGDPSAETLFLLSFTEIKLGRFDAAKNHLLQVIEADPGFHQAYYNLALIYFDEKQMKEAEAYSEKAVELNPGQASYQKTLDQIRNVIESSAEG